MKVECIMNMDPKTESKLRSEIQQLIGKRLCNQQRKNAEEIICIIRDVMKILNEEYLEEEVRGFMAEWNQETEKFAIRTFPSEVFPNLFMTKDGEQKKLATQISNATCTSENFFAICQFFCRCENVSTKASLEEEMKENLKITFK